MGYLQAIGQEWHLITLPNFPRPAPKVGIRLTIKNDKAILSCSQLFVEMKISLEMVRRWRVLIVSYLLDQPTRLSDL